MSISSRQPRPVRTHSQRAIRAYETIGDTTRSHAEPKAEERWAYLLRNPNVRWGHASAFRPHARALKAPGRELDQFRGLRRGDFRRRLVRLPKKD
jgi:hypothetical protein